MKYGAGEDSKEKSKSKGALVAIMAGAPSSTPSAPAEDDHGFKALARAFGIPPEREASAKAALKQYVKECVASMEGSESEESEEESLPPLGEDY